MLKIVIFLFYLFYDDFIYCQSIDIQWNEFLSILIYHITQKKIINCDTNEEYDSDDNVDDSEEMRKKEE